MFSFLKGSHAHLGEDKVIEQYLDTIAYPPNDFIVDIGAGDGIKMSNTYRFYKQGHSGLAIEANPDHHTKLVKNYQPFENVCTTHEKVSPSGIVDLLSGKQVPQEFLLLDLDIDSYDYFVLEAVLKSFRPAIILTEINESIPPPIKFKVQYDEQFQWKGGHFFGYSIACLGDIIEEHDYSLVQLHYNNAVLISNDYWNKSSVSIVDAYQIGYLNQPLRKRKFHYNAKLEYLLKLPPKEVENALKEYFKDVPHPFDLEY